MRTGQNVCVYVNKAEGVRQEHVTHGHDTSGSMLSTDKVDGVGGGGGGGEGDGGGDGDGYGTEKDVESDATASPACASTVYPMVTLTLCEPAPGG